MAHQTPRRRIDPFMKDGKTPRCREEIMRYIGNWPEFGQCSRSAQVGDRCRQHDPEAVKERARESQKRYDADMNERRYGWNGPKFFGVLERIAAGHNDPRTLAQETIDEFKKGERS